MLALPRRVAVFFRPSVPSVIRLASHSHCNRGFNYVASPEEHGEEVTVVLRQTSGDLASCCGEYNQRSLGAGLAFGFS